MVGPLITNTCALYGASTYANSWIGINYLVIIVGFFIIALVYILSKFMSTRMSTRVTGMIKVEIVELFISAIIIGILVVFASVACNVSAGLAAQATGTAESPFLYSDFYVGNLTFNTGLSLLSYIYSASIGYSIDARFYTVAAGFLGELAEPPEQEGSIQITFPFGYDLGEFYNTLSDTFLGLISEFVVITLGVLFLEWISIPIIQATAFVVILPIAIIMRSLAFSSAGGGIRSAANAALAIAIAGYIIYPLAISFNPCIMQYIFNNNSNNCFMSTNPSASYLPGYTITTLPPSALSTISGYAGNHDLGIATSPQLSSLINTAFNLGVSPFNLGSSSLLPENALSQVKYLINNIAEFIFQGIVLFAIDVAIAAGFAVGLTNALNSGLGQSPFWSRI